MKSSINKKKPFFSKFTQIEYSFETALKEDHLATIVDHCLRSILPDNVFRDKPIQDLKGKDIYSLNGDKLHEELAHIEGEILFDEEGTTYEEPIEFAITIKSVFKEFVGSHHILHDVEITGNETFPEYIPVKYIGYTPGVRIRVFRLGIEKFKSKFSGLSFGYSPVVSEQLSLEVENAQLTLRVTSDSCTKASPLPFTEEDLLKKLGARIGSASDEDPYKDLERKNSGIQ